MNSLENQTGKRIDFNTDIAPLDVDEKVLTGLRSCLVHLMRNAIDHGITSSESEAADGTLELKIESCGNTLIVEFSDNGEGLNLDEVGERAIQNREAAQTHRPHSSGCHNSDLKGTSEYEQIGRKTTGTCRKYQGLSNTSTLSHDAFLASLDQNGLQIHELTGAVPLDTETVSSLLTKVQDNPRASLSSAGESVTARRRPDSVMTGEVSAIVITGEDNSNDSMH